MEIQRGSFFAGVFPETEWGVDSWPEVGVQGEGFEMGGIRARGDADGARGSRREDG